MSIGDKIIAPIVVLILVFGAIYTGESRLEILLERGVREDLQHISRAGAVMGRLTSYEHESILRVLSYRFSQQREDIAILRDVRVRLAETTEELQSLLRTPQEQKLFADYLRYSRAIGGMQEALVAAIDERDARKIDQAFAAWELQHERVDAALKDMDEYYRRRGGQLLDEMRLVRERSNATVNVSLLFMMLAMLVVTAYYRQIIARPILRLAQAARQVAAGSYAVPLPDAGRDEIGQLTDSFREMAGMVDRYTSDLEGEIRKKTGDVMKQQAELRAANEFLDAIIENIPHMIFLKDTAELRFVRFNKAGEELLGYRREDLLGKNDYDFFPQDQAEAFIRKDRETLSKKEIEDIPSEPIDTKSKGKRFLRTKKITLRDAEGRPQYLLGISEDITEDKLRQDELLRYKQAVDASSDGIIILSPSMDVEYINPAWTRITGMEPGDIMGKSAAVMISSEADKALYAAVAEAMQAGRSFHSDALVRRRKDGSEYAGELTLYPVSGGSAGEKVRFFVGIHADITERKRADAAKSEFVSLASHQLRMPLSAVRLALSTLLRHLKGPLNREQEAIVAGAHRHALDMSATIRTLLSISLAEERKIEISPESVTLADLLGSVLTANKDAADEKGVALAADCPGDLTVVTDGRMLAECVGNLAANAVRYTPSGGSVRMSARQEGGHVRIDVRDTGIGIPAHARDKIFSKFYRAENAVRVQTDGIGLGLYLVSSFVTLLGGTVTFDSQEGKGSCFTIVLPSAPPATA